MYVIDSSNTRIDVFDAHGTLERFFDLRSAGAGWLTDPQAITVDTAGNVYVFDNGSSRVVKLQPRG